MKHLRLLLSFLLAISCLTTLSISVSADDSAEIITVEYTIDDIKALFDTVDSWLVYEHEVIPTKITPQFGIADNYPFYIVSSMGSHPSGYVVYEFKFPFSATVVSSEITLFTGNDSFQVSWENILNAPILWNLSNSGTFNFTSGFSSSIYTYNYSGSVDTQNLYISDSAFYSEGNGAIFGIKSLTVSYLGSEFNSIVNQLKEQNIKLEGIEKALEESNQRLDDIESSINDSAQEIIENQDSNTQEILENQDSNTQEIIDNDKELWDDTFNPTDEEVDNLDVNIHDTVSDIEEKLGLFTFLDDTLTRVLNMFKPYTGDLLLTFPGFSIDINNETYTIWEPFVYDARSVISGFDDLVYAVNMGCVVVVYSALINYLYNVFNRIFIKK